MYRISAFLLAVSLLAVPIAAHADTKTFALTDFTFLSGATATGSITINVTTGQFVSGHITYVGAATYVFNGAFQGQGVFNGNQYYGDLFTLPGGNGFDLDLDLPLTSLVDYTGGGVCSSSANCPGGFAGGLTPFPNTDNFDYFASGSFIETSPIPEPSSLLLFGTGLLGAVGSIRRRLIS